LSSFFTIEDNLRFLLTKFSYLRDAKNEEVVRMYRHHIFMSGNPSSESITRTFRKVKEKYPDLFGPTHLETIQKKQDQTERIWGYVRYEQ